MIPSRLVGPRILRVRLLTALGSLAILGGPTAWAQAQPTGTLPTPSLSEAERTPRLQERDRHRNEAIRLANSGKLDGAIQEAEAALAIECQVRGEFSEDVAMTRGILAKMHEFREDWASARKALQDVLALRVRQPNRKDWRVGEARRALADLERRASMTPEQRQRFRRARQLQDAVAGLLAGGRYEDAKEASLQALQTVRELEGEDHNDCATNLSNLGVLYQASGDYVRAEPLLQCAMEITKKALGDDHPDYAISLGNLGGLYKAMGDHARAEPLYFRAWRVGTRRWARTMTVMPTA